MRFYEIKEKAKNYPIFALEDIFKWFPKAKRGTILNQLSFWAKRGLIENICRGVYKIVDGELKDPFILSNFIYSPSYISLESALNYYGIIPDIPFGITSVTLNKTKIFKTKKYGVFYYHHIKPDLFFGFRTILVEKNYSYNIALPEKAIFDYFYLKAKKVESAEGFIEEMRLSLPKKFNLKKLKKWSNLVSKKNKTFFQLIEILTKKYANK